MWLEPTAAHCSTTGRTRSNAPSIRPAANSTASSINPSAEPSNHPRIPRKRQIVEQQLAMSAQGAGDFLHGLDARAHGLIATEIQEVAGPGGRVVFPELLKIFFEEIGADGLQVVTQQFAQTEVLLRGEILFALENAPARFLQQRLMTLLGHLA